MSDRFDDYDEGQSYPGIQAPLDQTQQHPHARFGDISPVPGDGKVFSPADALVNHPELKAFAPQPGQHRPPVAQMPPQAPQMIPQALAPQIAPMQAPQQVRPPQARPAAPQPLPEAPHFSPSPVPPPPRVPSRPLAPGAEGGYPHDYQAQQVPQNPLSRYMRMPGLSMRLPTDGVFMPQGSIEFTMTGEVNVYPMTAADELLLKSPDALMNGLALESMLISCVPGIKYPRLISNPDLDVLLLAIKAASQGNTMEIEFDCPECKQHAGMDIDLRHYLATAFNPMPDSAVAVDEHMTVHIRPYNLHNATQTSKGMYHEMRSMQAAEAKGKEALEEQNVLSFRAMTALDIAMTADCVLQINVPEGVVNDKKQIMEFIPTLSNTKLKKITDRLSEMNSAGLDKSTPVECVHCRHQWVQMAEFNPSSFFDVNS